MTVTLSVSSKEILLFTVRRGRGAVVDQRPKTQSPISVSTKQDIRCEAVGRERMGVASQGANC